MHACMHVQSQDCVDWELVDSETLEVPPRFP